MSLKICILKITYYNIISIQNKSKFSSNNYPLNGCTSNIAPEPV